MTPIADSAIATSVTGQGKPMCFLLAGYVPGIVEEVLQKSVRLREVGCVATVQI